MFRRVVRGDWHYRKRPGHLGKTGYDPQRDFLMSHRKRPTPEIKVNIGILLLVSERFLC